MFVGLPADNRAELPIFETVLGAINIVGSIGGTRADLREVFRLHSAGRTRLIREVRPLDAVNESMADVEAGRARLAWCSGSRGDLRTEVRAALAAGARALILDLRGNGGGLIREAIDVASAFIAHGTIMSTEERGQPRRVYMARGDAIAPGIPMAVLVDHGTASAAEIVTAALQDQGRAEMVGTETHGKGVFQVREHLRNGGALDISVGRYFSPDGHSLSGGSRSGPGVTPNVYARDDPETTQDEALAVAERTVSGKAG